MCVCVCACVCVCVCVGVGVGVSVCVCVYTLGNKLLYPHLRQEHRHWIDFIVLWAVIDMKCTCDCFPRKSDLTLARLSLLCQVGSLKSNIAGLCTVAIWNQHLRIFSQFPLIILILSHPIPIGIRHDVLALAREGMWQSDIAGHVGLSPAALNRILRRYAATGTLVPGNRHGGSSEDYISSRLCFVENGQ